MASEIMRKMLPFEEADEEPSPQLIDQKSQTITALARSNGNKQIARAFGISERTVRNHVSNIYKKLHVYDRTQAVLYAIREGLVDVEDVCDMRLALPKTTIES